MSHRCIYNYPFKKEGKWFEHHMEPAKRMPNNLLNLGRKLSLDGYRLDFDRREDVPVEWLLEDNARRLKKFRNSTLMMSRSIDCGYEQLTQEKKDMIDKFWANEDIVNCIIVTMFQWFGTNVGSCDMNDLMKKVNESGRFRYFDVEVEDPSNYEFTDEEMVVF
jgi:hypothetical protein